MESLFVHGILWFLYRLTTVCCDNNEVLRLCIADCRLCGLWIYYRSDFSNESCKKSDSFNLQSRYKLTEFNEKCQAVRVSL